MRSIISGVVAGVLISAPLQVSPALAQSECTCVLPASTGPVGSISTASPDVLITGPTGLQPAVAGVPIVPGSVVTTGPAASAGINLGAGCRFSMAGSMRLLVLPQEAGLCVQVIDESALVPPPTNQTGISGGQIAMAGGLLAGVGVLVSLGYLNPVSK